MTNQVSGGPSYDANGNQLNSTPATLTWNALNQPISVNSTTATYDALGRMVEKGSGGTYTQFVFRPSGAMLAVYSGGLVKGTIPLPGGSTAIYNTSGVNYIRHKDWLGSSRLATTWAHAVYSKEAYAPFGETYNEATGTGVATPDRSFTGQDQNVATGAAGTGVYDFLFRKYDPSAGRWLSPDPSGWNAVNLRHPQSLNRYAYVENSPMDAVDPDGLSCYTNWINGVSVEVDDGDSLGCAAAGVAPSTPGDPTGTNDGTVSVTVNGTNPSVDGSGCTNSVCLVVLLTGSPSGASLGPFGPQGNPNGDAPNNTKAPGNWTKWGITVGCIAGMGSENSEPFPTKQKLPTLDPRPLPQDPLVDKGGAGSPWDVIPYVIDMAKCIVNAWTK